MYRLLALFLWVVAGSYAFSNWGRLVWLAGLLVPNYAGIVAGGVLFLAAALLLMCLAKLGDLIIPKPSDEEVRITADEIRAKAEKRAKVALKANDKASALGIYEAAGMNLAALQLAQDLEDKPAMARLFAKLGRYMAARKLCVELGDFLSAAHLSGQMNDIEAARSYYGRVAREREAKGDTNLEAAGLWDRAGHRAKAALYYEECDELELAGECYELAGDGEGAKRCADRLAAVRLLERRQPGDIVQPTGLGARSMQYRDDMVKSAMLFEKMGDYFEAGMNWRKIEQFDKAGAAFEKFEEWERAARCYLADGENAKAREMRRRLSAEPSGRPGQASALESVVVGSSGEAELYQAGEIEEEPVAAATPVSVSVVSPSSSSHPTPVEEPQTSGGIPQSTSDPEFHPPSRHFTPLAEISQEAVPVFFKPDPGEIPANIPEAGDADLKAAAEQALAAHQWVRAADLYEQEGDRLRAAELYRELGKIDEAISCLEKAERGYQAALLELGLGRRDRAVSMLLRVCKSNPDAEVGALLGDLLVKDGRYGEAVGILRNVLSPGGVTQQNARLHFDFARTLARAGGKREAVEVLRGILAAGAESPEIEKMILDMSPGEVLAKPFHPVDSNNDIPSRRAGVESAQPKLTARDFLMAAIKEPSSGEEAIKGLARAAPLDGKVGRTGRFLFKPFAGEGEKGGPVGNAMMSREISLFGRPDAGILSTSFAQARNAGPAKLAPSQPGLAVISSVPGGGADPFGLPPRYQIVREIGRGGCAVVFEAMDRFMGRSIALKLVQQSHSNPEQIEEFLLECRALARLTHANIVSPHDVGLIDLKHFVAMELVRGETLKELIAEQGRLPPKEALRVFIEIGQGLQAAHNLGILHRGIKPSNVLVATNGSVKVVDFSMVNLTGSSGMGDGEIGEGRDVEILRFMSPEQIQRQVLGPPCDIYALGLTLYTMLVGVPPSLTAGKLDYESVVQFQVKGKLPHISHMVPDIPDAFERLFEYCTAVSPGERYQAFDDFLPSVRQMLDAF